MRIEKNDQVSVRPMGSFNSISGKFVSRDDKKGTVTIVKADGKEETIMYGQIFNYGQVDENVEILKEMLNNSASKNRSDWRK